MPGLAVALTMVAPSHRRAVMHIHPVRVARTAALLLSLGATAALAQSVTLYGVIDSSVEVVNRAGASGDTLVRVPTQTGTVPSRVGLRGGEDLGGGLRAVFALEHGFAPDAGLNTQGGRLWGRQAWVGVSSSWGTLSLGRQYTMLFYSLLEADLLGPNMYSSGSLDAYIPNARADNALGYRGTFGPLTLGAGYSFGRDTVNAGPSPGGTNCAGERAGDARACRAWSGLLKFDQPAWGAALAIDKLHGGPGAFAGLVRSELTDTRVSANGYVKLGPTKLAAGLLRRNNEGSAATPRSDLWYAGIAWAATPRVTLDGQVYRLDFDGSANRSLLVAARVQFALSRRTTLYITAGTIDNDGALDLSVSGGAPGSNTAPGGSQQGLTFGLRHAF
jgi:predicted porin